jgi:hypothetical protein
MPPGLATVNKRPFAAGGFADVWKARSRNNQAFAVKNIRVYEVDNLENMKKVLRVCSSVSVGISHWNSVPRVTAKRLLSVSE